MADHDVSDDDNNGPCLGFDHSASTDDLLNTMNFHAMSDCIVTIQNNRNTQQTAVGINQGTTNENQPNSTQQCVHNPHIGHQFQFNHLLIAQSQPSRPLDTTTTSSALNQQAQLQTADSVDEYVSFDCVKKLLDEQDMDYIDSTMQNHIELEYFNAII